MRVYAEPRHGTWNRRSWGSGIASSEMGTHQIEHSTPFDPQALVRTILDEIGTPLDLVDLAARLDGLRLDERLSRLQADLSMLVQQRTVKDYYSTEEVAEILNKKPFTVRGWCRDGRVLAKKLLGGRGNEGEWRISHEELTRIQNEGLLPVR